MKRSFLLLIISALILFGCSTSQETVKEESKGEVYVFDEVPTDTVDLDIEPVENAGITIPPMVTKYYVQIGAFTTKEAANEFASTSRKTLKKEVFVKFSPDAELFVVQLAAFRTREEAEKVRNELWKKKEFKDAFILTIDEAIIKEN